MILLKYFEINRIKKAINAICYLKFIKIGRFYVTIIVINNLYRNLSTKAFKEIFVLAKISILVMLIGNILNVKQIFYLPLIN